MAAILWVALAITGRRSPGVRYRVACAALAAAVGAPVATVYWLTPARPLTPRVEAAPGLPAVPLVRVESVPAIVVPVAAFPAVAPAWDRSMPWVSAGWAAGVAAVGLWNAAGWLGVQRLRRWGVAPVSAELERVVGRLADRLGVRRATRLLASVHVDSPLVVGLWRPLILLPASLLCELPADQLEALLAHELAHVRRHDYAVNLLQCAAETLLFYHPVVWWISRRIRAEREHCCDDLAVSISGDRAGYVRALAAVAEPGVPRLALAARGDELLPRVRRVLGLPAEPNRSVPRTLIAGVACAILVGAESLWAPHLVRAKEATTMPAKDAMVLRGRVLDPTGTPLSGAAVIAGFADGFYADGSVLGRATSGADGAFAVSVDRAVLNAPRKSDRPAVLAASAAGFGPAAASLADAVKTGLVGDLHLVPDDVPIDGRVVDPAGQPVAGVRVAVRIIQPVLLDLNQTDASGYNPAMLRFHGVQFVPPFAEGITREAATDSDGRFRLTGIGRDRTVDLDIVPPTPDYTAGYARVLTRPGPRAAKTVMQYLPRTFVTFGSTFEFPLIKGVSVEGFVTDAATGKPIAGARLQSTFLDASSGVAGWRHVMSGAPTGIDGRYRLDGIPPGKENRFAALPPDDQPYLQREFNVPPDATADAVVRHDIALHRGVWLSGRATEATSGRPVQGRVYYTPFRSNPAAANLPEFPEKLMMGNWPAKPYETKPDGTFRVAVLPGPALVGIQFPDQPYRFGVGAESVHVKKDRRGWTDTFVSYDPKFVNVVEQVDVPADGLVGVDLQLESGQRIRVTTVGPDGQPLTGVWAYFLSRGRIIGGEPKQMSTATFDATNFAPDEKRTLMFRDETRVLGAAVPIGPPELKAGAITATLQPLAKLTGRLVDQAGQPVVDARVDTDEMTVEGATVADGRFTLAVPVGIEHALTRLPQQHGETFFSAARTGDPASLDGSCDAEPDVVKTGRPGRGW